MIFDQETQLLFFPIALDPLFLLYFPSTEITSPHSHRNWRCELLSSPLPCRAEPVCPEPFCSPRNSFGTSHGSSICQTESQPCVPALLSLDLLPSVCSLLLSSVSPPLTYLVMCALHSPEDTSRQARAAIPLTHFQHSDHPHVQVPDCLKAWLKCLLIWGFPQRSAPFPSPNPLAG